MFTVADVMTPEVVTLEEHDDLSLAETIFNFGHIRHLPVVREGRLVGPVTHRDLLRALAGRAPNTTAGALMTREVSTVTPSTSLKKAIRRMLHHKYGCLPVVEGSGRLVGIVTQSDVLRLACSFVEELDRIQECAERVRS